MESCSISPFPADSPEGRLLCDELVGPGEMDAAVQRVSAAVSSSGVVSAAGNRKAIRVGQEPLSVFQAYMATYAREQALCHLSPALMPKSRAILARAPRSWRFLSPRLINFSSGRLSLTATLMS